METKYSLFSHIMKNLPPTTKKYDTLNLCTMGEMKSSRFPHSTEFRYKKTCTICVKIIVLAYVLFEKAHFFLNKICILCPIDQDCSDMMLR